MFPATKEMDGKSPSNVSSGVLFCSVYLRLLSYFVDRGADLLAVDGYGENALHQLLEAVNIDSEGRPPILRASLQYVASHYRILVNQPDHEGTYPLHAALQRMRCYWAERDFTAAARIETAVDDLLAAGADPLPHDGRGNKRNQAGQTLLHLVAGHESLRASDRFELLLSRGLDPMERDHEGRAPIDIADACEKEDGVSRLIDILKLREKNESR